MADATGKQVIVAQSLDEALAALTNKGLSAIPVAGGTWVMRAPIRQEATAQTFVSLHAIEELKGIEAAPEELLVGAMVSHRQLAIELSDIADLKAIRVAAEKSANPSVRNMATIGGNLCATDFMSPDLVPALMVCDATIRVQSAGAKAEIPIKDYIETRLVRPNNELVTRIRLPRGLFRSTHQRLLMGKAGEYSVANLSMRLSIDGRGRIANPRIAVASVENQPRRWIGLEDALRGEVASKVKIKELAIDQIGAFTGRDGPDAPGWYRLRILPRLASDALADLTAD
jgi:carbon-monoxide dehydrogenase medium subunit